jgi:hypothetical protein
MDDLEKRTVDRFLIGLSVGKNLWIASAVLLHQVDEDRSFVDESLYIAALQRLDRLDHKWIAPSGKPLSVHPLFRPYTPTTGASAESPAA